MSDLTTFQPDGGSMWKLNAMTGLIVLGGLGTCYAALPPATTTTAPADEIAPEVIAKSDGEVASLIELKAMQERMLRERLDETGKRLLQKQADETQAKLDAITEEYRRTHQVDPVTGRVSKDLERIRLLRATTNPAHTAELLDKRDRLQMHLDRIRSQLQAAGDKQGQIAAGDKEKSLADLMKRQQAADERAADARADYEAAVTMLEHGEEPPSITQAVARDPEVARLKKQVEGQRIGVKQEELRVELESARASARARLNAQAIEDLYDKRAAADRGVKELAEPTKKARQELGEAVSGRIWFRVAQDREKELSAEVAAVKSELNAATTRPVH